MATERSYLMQIDSDDGSSTNITNNTTTPDSGEARSIRQVLADIRAGRVHIGPVLTHTLIAVMGSLSLGLILGYSSLTEVSLAQARGSDGKFADSHVDTGFMLSPAKFAYFGASVNIAALIAGLIMGVVSDKIGRKPSMLISCFPLVFGWSAIAMSYYYTGVGSNSSSKGKFYTMLMVGRVLTGFSMGSLSLVIPTYIIEISPTSLKGLLTSMHQLAVTVGGLSVYLLGSYKQYHVVALIAGVVGVIYSIAILFIPETPRWLLSNNQEKPAVVALQKLRGRSYHIDGEISVLMRAIEMEGKLTFAQKIMEFKKTPVIIALTLSLALMFFQQFSGINAVIFYGASITASAHIKDAELVFSLGIGLTQVIVTLIGVILVDVLGRKKLLVIGGALLSLGTSLLALYYNLCPSNEEHDFCSSFSYMAVVGLVIFITGFSVGWGAIPWVMMGELAPLKVRGIMGGIATAANWSFATIVTMFFSDYQNKVHPYGAWWTFAGVTLLSIPFVIFILPETKGKTLEEIQTESNTWFKRKPGRK